jgi:hypothetical protein
MEDGIEQGKLDDERKMIARGMSDGDIRVITGLSQDKISRLRNNNGQ